MPWRTMSGIGGRRASLIVKKVPREQYVEAMRPEASLRGHLTFHLKHEVPNFELLARVFERCDAAELAAWVQNEPTGQYSRRSAFLYEFFTGRQLPVPEQLGGAYVDAIDDSLVVAASPDELEMNRRWRVRDNMPGTRAFCPLVVKASAGPDALDLDVKAMLHDLEVEFGTELLQRSAVWMTLRESKSSFAIEGEADKVDRVQRFADTLARRTGQGEQPLSEAALAELQQEILGTTTTLEHFGLRLSPVFVGEVHRYQEVVHYVAPPAAELAEMLHGLQTFVDRTKGQSPVMRAAVTAFGFVYIHPLADGNGRVHRFLINDVLRRDGVVKAPMILPISSLITCAAAERKRYDDMLDEISKPLMTAVKESYKFAGAATVYPDGIRSNLDFRGDDQARPVWRYLDLSPHVTYLAEIIERTVREDMQAESRYLRSHSRARSAIKDLVEMPDSQADRVIRSIENNRGELSGALSKEMPVLTKQGLWDDIVEAVRIAFREDVEPEVDRDAVDRYAPQRPRG